MSQANVEIVRKGWEAWQMSLAQITTVRDGKVVRIDNYEDQGEALRAAELAA